jgi:hypothetical protein
MDTNIELLRDPTELFTVAASLNKAGLCQWNAS